MYPSNSRAVGVTVGVMITVLAACTDEPTPTAPIPVPPPQFAMGDVYTVTNTQDAGIGSLRWALSFSTGGEIIRFDPSLAGHTITLDSSVYIRKSVTIEGPAGGGITIKGAGFDDRLFWARFNGTATLRNLSLTGAYTSAGVGSVIYAEANLTFENVLIHDNTADAGVALFGNHVTLINSTVTGTLNSVPSIYDYSAVMGDTVTVINSTVAGNGWGGVGSFNGVVRLRNSIVANNVGKNCVLANGATLFREGANLSDDDTCGGPGGIIIADPQLGPLAANGGPTMTHALLAGSPAINTGTDCSVSVDQRYVARDGQCDLGAFEFLDFTTVEVTLASSASVDRNGWAVITGSIRCSRHETFDLFVRLFQRQKSGRSTTDVEGGALTAIACTPTARPWSVSVVASQPFDAGEALVYASLRNAEPWIMPVSHSESIKLFKSRK